jgi:hypothetical protein
MEFLRFEDVMAAIPRVDDPDVLEQAAKDETGSGGTPRTTTA